VKYDTSMAASSHFRIPALLEFPELCIKRCRHASRAGISYAPLKIFHADPS
jgi:hypothetical protein